MVIRVCRAKAIPGRETEVANTLRDTTPLIRAAQGCLSADVGSHLVERTEEFIVISAWRDMASIERFGRAIVDEPFFPERMVGLITGALVGHFEGITDR